MEKAFTHIHTYTMQTKPQSAPHTGFKRALSFVFDPSIYSFTVVLITSLSSLSLLKLLKKKKKIGTGTIQALPILQNYPFQKPSVLEHKCKGEMLSIGLGNPFCSRPTVKVTDSLRQLRFILCEN